MHHNKIKPQNKSVQLTRHGTAETTLNDIQKKFGSVFLVFSTALFHCENCADFLQIKMAVREHFKQSLHYVNHSIYLIETDYPQASIHPVSFVLITQMIDNLDSLNNQSLEQSHFLIEEIAIKQNQTLGLLVDFDNPSAKKLYEKKGFVVVGEKTLMSEHHEHMQYNQN